ncbi:MAG: hypothetical protein PHY09_18430 [Desulfuromonadaceae bacterium]|nr:hypothetical protein [Desulfuromonadaceae bacterium]MDD5107554.1 hypothetical protein [Desulfuromonadaceae bacterium]
MELSGLHLQITIGNYKITRCPRWWIESLRHFPLGRAGVTLPDPDGELYTAITEDEPVVITFGYRDQAPVEWRGTVARRYPGETADQLEIRAIDQSKPLSTVNIKQAWENETPEAIVAFAIRQAGLKVGKIGETGMVLPRFSAATIPVWQLIQQVKQSCREAFALDMSQWALWLGKDGVNWGDFDEPGDVVTIATFENLIQHSPTDWTSGMSLVETFLTPDLSHSRLIHLKDERRQVDATHRALRVRHEGTPDKIRTFVWYGRENG